MFISEHSSSVLEIVSTDWRPVASVSFAKDRGKERREDLIVNFEQFINVKGISALGNQLTKFKVNQIDLIESLPFKQPEETPADEIDVVDEIILYKPKEVLKEETPFKQDKSNDSLKGSESGDAYEEGQTTLF